MGVPRRTTLKEGRLGASGRRRPALRMGSAVLASVRRCRSSVPGAKIALDFWSNQSQSSTVSFCILVASDFVTPKVTKYPCSSLRSLPYNVLRRALCVRWHDSCIKIITLYIYINTLKSCRPASTLTGYRPFPTARSVTRTERHSMLIRISIENPCQNEHH